MRFMVIVKADKSSEAGVMPSQQMLEEMTAYNEMLAKAGVLVAGEGLRRGEVAAGRVSRGRCPWRSASRHLRRAW